VLSPHDLPLAVDMHDMFAETAVYAMRGIPILVMRDDFSPESTGESMMRL
jgi:hypothetical protein